MHALVDVTNELENSKDKDTALYCTVLYCTVLYFLHPLIWLSVNHVSLFNLSHQLSNMLTFATIHFDTILCHTLFSPTICIYCMYCVLYQCIITTLHMDCTVLYCTVLYWLRCLLSFSLLRSSILCIRGTRSNRNYIPRLPASFDLAVGESCVAV